MIDTYNNNNINSNINIYLLLLATVTAMNELPTESSHLLHHPVINELALTPGVTTKEARELVSL
jgi:hypothetical protein